MPLAAIVLVGRILFNTLPVPGAIVTASHEDRKVATLSDEDGAFRFTNLEDGVWTIRVEMRGFVTATKEIAVPYAGPALEFTLVMRPYEEIVAGANTITPPVPSPAAVDVEPPPDSPDIINGSVNNGAASPFAQPRAFGNNRPRQGALYTGSVNGVIGDSAWNARPFSFAGSSAPTPNYSDVLVGLTIGGPLKIPRLVRNGPQIFFNYQHNLLHSATTESALMPTAAERGGDFSATATAIHDPATGVPYAGNQIPRGLISPQATALLSYYLPPTGTIANGANFQTTVVSVTTQDSVQAGMNKTVARKNTLDISLTFQRTATDSTSLFNFIDNSRQSSLNASANWLRRFSLQTTLRLRYQFSRSSTNVIPFFSDRTNVSGEAGINGNDQDPSNWGPPALLFPDVAQLRDVDFKKTTNLAHGAGAEMVLRRHGHNMTFGGDVRRTHADALSQSNPRGTLTFTGAATGSAFADFLLGIPSASSIALGDAGTRLRASTYDAYFTDDWKLAPGVTVNAGVRWEYEAPFVEASGRLANLDVSPNFSATSAVVASTPTGPLTGIRYPRSLIRPDRGGIEPRVAASWRPWITSSFVIRGSYGLYRNLGLYQSIALLLAQQPPVARTFSIQNSAATPLTLANPFPSTLPNTANTFGVDPDFRPGYAHNWQLSMQRDIPASLTVIAAYFGAKGIDLTQAFLPNTFPQGAANPCPACPSGFVYVVSHGTSLRNAAQFTIRRRLHAGFTASVQYTLAKSTDNAATFSNAIATPASLALAQNWLDLEAERAPSAFDQRHLVTAQFQYTTGVAITGGTLLHGFWGSLYKDWTVAGQINAGSGLPLTPVAFVAVPGTGFVGVRPRLTGDSIDPVVSGSYANAAAFGVPLTGSWGDAGRNSIRGPSQLSFDLNVSRVFRFGQRWNLEWRVSATNVLNHVTFATIGTVITSPQFGLPTQANPMRRVQTSFRLRF